MWKRKNDFGDDPEDLIMTKGLIWEQKRSARPALSCLEHAKAKIISSKIYSNENMTECVHLCTVCISVSF